MIVKEQFPGKSFQSVGANVPLSDQEVFTFYMHSDAIKNSA